MTARGDRQGIRSAARVIELEIDGDGRVIQTRADPAVEVLKHFQRHSIGDEIDVQQAKFLIGLQCGNA